MTTNNQMNAAEAPVLIVHVPAAIKWEWRELRDYVSESIGMGVLVLGKDVELEVANLPKVEQVQVAPMPAPVMLQTAAVLREHSVAKAKPQEAEPEIKYTGVAGAEKTRIRQRMEAYRTKHGLGCWAKVAKTCGKDVTDDMLREIYNGALSPNIQVWRAIDGALSALEGSDAQNP